MPDIDIRKDGKAGRITLTRPKALNALTHDMALQIENALRSWVDDPSVQLVIIDAEGSKGFCAGGDIQALYDHGRRGDFDYGRKFWRDEYRLNALIAAYPKPYVAIMDGIVMGGGVGISMHGSHRIVTENTVFAMPECSIGLVPDVGGSLLLAQMPGFLGEFTGLTGARFKAEDCIYSDLAETMITADKREELVKALVRTGDVDCIEDYELEPNISIYQTHKDWINNIFSHDDLETIFQHVDDNAPDALAKAVKGLRIGAPLSLIWELGLIRSARNHDDIKQSLVQEYRAVSIASSDGEFLEGIRAAIIDKDRAPRWQYSELKNVPTDLADAIWRPAIDGDITWGDSL